MDALCGIEGAHEFAAFGSAGVVDHDSGDLGDDFGIVYESVDNRVGQWQPEEEQHHTYIGEH